ncbi:MAG: DUF2007 domain-containing protein [Planctomycetes bacterium]|nr:DUF2007 domain-containing protein [Planctomycetota bacterium]
MKDPAGMVTARIATSPVQARFYAALLEGEGIRAYVDGATLVDEVAMSRALMNVNGTHVKVRRDQLERARDVLGDVEIDDDELEAQALAAGPVADREPASEKGTNRELLLYLAVGIMIVVTAWAIRELTQG